VISYRNVRKEIKAAAEHWTSPRPSRCESLRYLFQEAAGAVTAVVALRGG